MNELVGKLRLLIKAEIILFRLNLRYAARQAAFYFAAVLLILLAIGMLNIALYLYLVPRLDRAGSALVVAGIDAFLAVVAIIAAGRLQIGSEAVAANELRDLTMAEIESDAERIKVQIADLSDDIKRIRSAVTGFWTAGSAGLTSALQWVMMLLRVFWQHKNL